MEWCTHVQLPVDTDLESMFVLPLLSLTCNVPVQNATLHWSVHRLGWSAHTNQQFDQSRMEPVVHCSVAALMSLSELLTRYLVNQQLGILSTEH